MKKILLTLVVLFVTMATTFAQTPTNDTCENAIELECGIPLNATTLGATNTDNDFEANPEVFFTFTSGAVSEEVTFSLCNTIDIGQLILFQLRLLLVKVIS